MKDGRAGGPAPAPASSRASEDSFDTELRAAIQEFDQQWAPRPQASAATDAAELAGLPLPRRGSSEDAVDVQLLRAAIRPEIRAVVRQAVRTEARQAAAIANARLLTRPPPAAARNGVPAGKGAASRQQSTGKAAPAPARQAGNPPADAAKTKQGGDDPKVAPPKDLLGGRAPEAILPELAAHRFALRCPVVAFQDYMGECTLVRVAQPAQQPPPQKKVRTGGKAVNAATQAGSPPMQYPELSMAQARQAVAACCALPLGFSGAIQSRLARPTSALLYGPKGSGKTLLAMAAASAAGAALFDLSPAATAGKYPGKEADVLVHLVRRPR